MVANFKRVSHKAYLDALKESQDNLKKLFDMMSNTTNTPGPAAKGGENDEIQYNPKEV